MEGNPEVILRLRAARRAVRWAFDPDSTLSWRYRWTCLWGAAVLTLKAFRAAVRP